MDYEDYEGLGRVAKKIILGSFAPILGVGLVSAAASKFCRYTF